MLCLEKARQEVARQNVTYCEANHVSFQDDVILLPAGDGAAVCFPFDCLHDVHLQFALELLKEVAVLNSENECTKFVEQGWCNCHSSFGLTVGISDGKCVLYKDVNTNYNISGNAINMAARVMNAADANQIILTEEAYKNLIDIVEDPYMDEYFKVYPEFRIKHDLKISVYQYIGKGENFVNSEPPEDLKQIEKTGELKSKMQKLGLPFLDEGNFDRKKMPEFIEKFSKVLDEMVDMASLAETRDQVLIEQKTQKD